LAFALFDSILNRWKIPARALASGTDSVSMAARGEASLAASIALATVLLVSAVLAIFALQPSAPLHSRATTRSVLVLNVPRHALAAVKDGREKTIPVPPSDFALEQQMNHSQLMARWAPLIARASKRFGVPETWIHAVMQAESGGRTMLGENQPIKSSAGAMGLMQLMPSTYADMRSQYGLGPNPYDPEDNIVAGTAYLRWLRSVYGYPQMFAAYNDGPGNLEQRLRDGGLLPAETQNYVAYIAAALSGGAGGGRVRAKFTRPDGSPVWINSAAAISVRAAMPGEYAPTVQSVITVGRVRQGVRESVAAARAIIRAHGGG
jgi:soluble lytic murein transglycosylase-like protein